MKILKTQVLSGPNIWSNYRNKLIQVKIDLEEMERFPTDKISGFAERMKESLPNLVEHECSEGVRGGFFISVERGTWMVHVIEHVALEIQTLAGMMVGYGRTRETSVKGVYNMVFSYEVKEAGLYASDAAFRIVDAISKNEPYDINNDVEELKRLRNRYGLGPSTRSIVEEAERRGIPWTRLGTRSKIQLGYGKNQKQFQATMTYNTSAIAVDTAANKEETKQILAQAAIPVARGTSCKTMDELLRVIRKIGYPLVIKPINGNHGRGVTTNIKDEITAETAFYFAKQFSSYLIVERFVEGNDFRLLVIDGKFVAASERNPAHIIGDGSATIQMLIDDVNRDPKRGIEHEAVLTRIICDDDTLKLLTKAGYNYESIPKNLEKIVLKSTANLSTGGTAVDVTDEIHPANVLMAQRAAKLIGLDICGIDVIAANISTPILDNGGVVLEVNAAPGFRMHIAPSEGKPRNVAKAVVDMLYPIGTESTIPVFAITGTNGKTTTTRLLSHIAKMNNYTPGYTTTDGVYIGDYKIKTGDTTGPLSAALILRDPEVDFAILETARGGLLRSGLAFDKCDVGIITNIQEDHLGINDINNLDDLANVKAVIARSVHESGWAVLNADDVHCAKIGSDLGCNIIYFSLDAKNKIIENHLNSGGIAAVVEDEFVVIRKENERVKIAHITEIPLADNGTAKFMIANILAATAATYVYGFPLDKIQTALRTFIPCYEQTPGRMNLFTFKDYRILVDYAHNPHGLLAMKDYLSHITCSRKIGIIAGIGDRREEDIIECGRIASSMFDHIIVRQEHGLRGRTINEINNLIIRGIQESEMPVTYDLFPKETEAIKRALSLAQSGDFIVALSDEYDDVIEIIKEAQNIENSLKANESINSK